MPPLKRDNPPNLKIVGEAPAPPALAVRQAEQVGGATCSGKPVSFCLVNLSTPYPPTLRSSGTVDRHIVLCPVPNFREAHGF